MADVDLGTKKPGETGSGSVTLAHPTPGDSSAADVTASISGGFLFDDGGTLSDTAPVPPAGATLTVKYVVQAGESAGVVSGSITGAAATKSVQVTVEHALTITGSLAFGTDVVGTTDTRTLSVTNQTDANAQLAIAPDTHYSLSTSVVDPGVGVTSVVVTFHPMAVGSCNATLTATSGSFAPTCDLTGAGAAVAAEFEASAGDADGDGTVASGEVKTTYKVHVPTQTTQMHLGAGVAPFGTALDGFGLQTTGKGLLHATGNIGINSLSGDLRLQAQSDDGNILAVSGGNSVFAAKGSVYVAGDGGVLISTALDVVTKVGNSSSGPDDGIPNPDDMTQGSTIAAAVFTSLDAIIAGASFVRVLKTTTWRSKGLPQPVSKVAVGAAAVSAGAAFTAAVLGTVSVLGNIDGFSPSVPGVTIYGHAGVLIGTPGFGGFYAAAGLVLGSIFPIMIGMDAEILGMRTAGVTGNDVSATAWRDNEITAGRHATLASGTNTLIKAGTMLQLAVDGIKLPGEEKDNRITLEEDELTIVVGDYAVTISTSGIMIGSNKAGAVDTALPRFQLNDKEAHVYGPGDSGARSWLHILKNEATLQGGTSDANAGQLALEDNKAELWAKASKITVDGAANSVKLNTNNLTFTAGAKIEMKGAQIKIG